MKPNKVKIIVLAGIVAFIGIIAIQVYWLKKAFEEEEKKFNQNVQVSLLEVAGEINHYYGYTTPHANPVERLSDDYYVVNMRNDFQAKVLEMLLVNKFRAKGINTNFEYAIYDCETDDMLYGSYVRINQKDPSNPSTYFPKVKNLVYYFAVRFPGKTGFIYQSLRGWIIVCAIMVVILLIYLYALYIILQQQRYARLQKDFINNMTHEFKTPLASILIASQFISKNEQVSGDEKLGRYARIITEQGRKLDNHLEKILNLAQYENNPMLLEKEKIDIMASIHKTIDIIQLKYPEAIVDCQPYSGNRIITADPFHFSNIMYNLLDNSIKYCEKRALIEISLEQKPKGLLLRIKDNGIGIAQRDLKHIFEKFYRVHEEKKKPVPGFGLGLFYVHKICQLHGWTLRAESVPGSGTSMTILIR